MYDDVNDPDAPWNPPMAELPVFEAYTAHVNRNDQLCTVCGERFGRHRGIRPNHCPSRTGMWQDSVFSDKQVIVNHDPTKVDGPFYENGRWLWNRAALEAELRRKRDIIVGIIKEQRKQAQEWHDSHADNRFNRSYYNGAIHALNDVLNKLGEQ